MRSFVISGLLLLIVVLGCRVGGRSDKPSEGAGPGRPPESEASASPSATVAEASDTPAEFEKREFSAGSLPAEAKYDGRVSKGASWIDANGENYLIVTERKTTRGQDDSVHEVFGYLYVTKDGSTRLLWKIQDSAENYCDNGKGVTSPVEVRDIDGDGVAENMFVYNIAGGCDVSPIPYKLMMHSGEKKLAVRGTNSVDVPDYRQKGEKNFDGFESSPASFKKAASDFWDKYVAPLRAN